MLISVSGHTSNLKFDGLNFPPGGAKLFEQKWPSFLTPSGQALVFSTRYSIQAQAHLISNTNFEVRVSKNPSLVPGILAVATGETH